MSSSNQYSNTGKDKGKDYILTKVKVLADSSMSCFWPLGTMVFGVKLCTQIQEGKVNCLIWESNQRREFKTQLANDARTAYVVTS